MTIPEAPPATPSAPEKKRYSIVTRLEPFTAELMTLAQAVAFANGDSAWRSADRNNEHYPPRIWRRIV